MKDNEWSDNQIKESFRKMPNVKDRRSKEAVLAKLTRDERLQPLIAKPKRKKSWLQALVAVAALLVLGLILPSMSSNHQSDTQESMGTPAQDSATSETVFNGSEHSAREAATEESAMDSTMYAEQSVAKSHILLPGQLHGFHAFQVGVTHEATVIPVTFLVSEKRVMEDFPEGEPDDVAFYDKYAKHLPESGLGFDEYHPYEGKLTVENNVIYHQLPSGHRYDIASAALDVYQKTIQSTFTDFIELRIVDEDGHTAQFDQVGKVEPIKLTGGKMQLPYYKYILPSGEVYLLPDGGITYGTVEEAIFGMKKRPNDLVQLLVPESVDYDVRVVDEIVQITFLEPLDLSKMDSNSAIEMIEGFILTAGNYDKAVKLENIVQESFLRYDLTSVLSKPAAVNPVVFK